MPRRVNDRSRPAEPSSVGELIWDNRGSLGGPTVAHWEVN
jgi:hypothetical protein